MKKLLSFIFVIALLSGCGETSSRMWAWVSGGDAVSSKSGIYGIKGVADAANIPGARSGSVSWTDNSGNLWLFGGRDYYDLSGYAVFNDLWKYDGINWTWMSGSNLIEQVGMYGAKGVAADSNVPGAREGAVSWTDNSGNLWLFGGFGFGEAFLGYLNDLWKFDGTNWIWISGNSARDAIGVFGTKGVTAAGNVPGARTGSVSWIDSSGNLWLFGGHGYDSSGNRGELNDLWKFDGTYWTWVSGSEGYYVRGVYGSKGIPAASNVPGARVESIAWIDKSNSLWLFGGNGRDSVGSPGYLNDLWKFNGTNWTWMSGSEFTKQKSSVGIKGIPSASNVPGARAGAISWFGPNGNFLVFGGQGIDSEGTTGSLNDLWKFDGTEWTWISGSRTAFSIGIYGQKGIASENNVPGARAGAASWIDPSGNIWLFGGHGYDSLGASGDLNDLWHYNP